MDFTCNIAIRTIIHERGHCQLGIGSGIVWDAEARAEYEETLVKAAFATPPAGDTWRPDPGARLRAAVRPPSRAPGVPSSARTLRPADELRLFETILLEPREGDATIERPMDLPGLSPSLVMCDSAVLARYAFLDDHLDRIAASARTLGFPFDREAALDLLLGLARLTPGSVVVHVELDSEGGLSQSTRNAPTWNAPLPSPGAFRSVTLMVSPFRTDPDDPFLRHKTTMRGFYNREHRRAVHDGFFDALFLNRLDRVTEGAITNVFARFDDCWLTPPVSDGLLPGVWRARFLERKGAAESSLTLEELLAADEILVGNSVRGGVSVGRLVADPVVF